MGDSDSVPGQGVSNDDGRGVDVGADNELEPAAGEIQPAVTTPA